MPTLYQALWIFLVYAFLGWCVEVVYQALVHGKFINRGFLNGPICPIYGFGMLAVVIALTPLKNNLLLLFLGSVLLTSALEFFTGFVLEKIFHDKWWDYSNEPCNLLGYVCLRFSLMWGLACMFVINTVHPIIMRVVDMIPQKIGTILLFILFVSLASDLFVTILAASKLRKRLLHMDEISARMRIVSDAVGSSLAEHAIELKDKLDEKKPEIDALHNQFNMLAAEARRTERRLLNAYPRLQRGKYQESIERIQKHAASIKEKYAQNK